MGHRNRIIKIRKADVILFIILLTAAGMLFLFPLRTRGNADSSQVVIRKNGQLYGRYSLYENRTIRILDHGALNEVIIQNGKVWMKEASCKNQLCVEESAISHIGQTLVCLPNRVAVEITGAEDRSDQEIDIVSK
jgi:hypothetical protein